MENINKHLDTADNALTKFGIIIKKHWGKLILISILVVIIWFSLLIKDEVEKENTVNNDELEEQYQESEDGTIVEEYYLEDSI